MQFRRKRQLGVKTNRRPSSAQSARPPPCCSSNHIPKNYASWYRQSLNKGQDPCAPVPQVQELAQRSGAASPPEPQIWKMNHAHKKYVDKIPERVVDARDVCDYGTSAIEQNKQNPLLPAIAPCRAQSSNSGRNA